MVERFLRPTSAAEALQMQRETGGLFLAGGTELNWGGPATARVLISLEGLPLGAVAQQGGFVTLGSTCSLQQLADDRSLGRAGLGLLVEAARAVGSRAVRGQATLGGNVASNKSCSDLLPSLMVLGAELLLATDAGDQVVPVEQYVAAPTKGALITGVRVPLPGAAMRAARERFSRTVNDLATLNVAVSLQAQPGAIAEPRVAVGGVAATVERLAPVEAALRAMKPGGATEWGDRLRKAVRDAVKPIDDLRGSAAFKTHLAEELCVRAVAACLAPQGGAR